MAWADGYLQAKFRDVEFFIRRAGKKSGRRNVRHTFPRRNEVEKEDLGQADQIFTLDAYLLGDDYFDQRAAFEAALDAGGEGVLVHPYRGVLRVVVDDWDGDEATEEGRIVRYSITFGLVAVEELTRAAPNTRRQLSFAKEELLSQAESDFIDIYDLAGKPAAAIRDARETLDKALGFIDSAKRVAGSVAEFKREIGNLKGDVIALSLNAQFLAQSMTGIVNFGTDFTSGLDFGVNSGNANDQIREQKQISAQTAEPVVSTPARLSADPGYPAKQIQELIKVATVAARVTLISAVPFGTVDEAEVAQSDLFGEMDAIMEDPNTSDDLYAAMRDAKVAVFDDLQSQVIRLPMIIEKDNTDQTNALSLNYEIYGNLDNEEDFIERNQLIHPGFVPAATRIQVRVVDE
jgi:prophage DNA circulation protein